MKILVTGASGLVGSHFVETLEHEFELITPALDELDITTATDVDRYISTYSPDCILHFAAHTDLNAAEEQRDNESGSVWKINVDGTRNLVSAAQKKQCFFVHISTDYVFSGKKDSPGPYSEQHGVAINSNEVSWYGWTKIQAEKIVQSYPHNHAIIRISSPCRAFYTLKPDYIRKILDTFDAGTTLKLFTDQWATLTYIPLVTNVLKKIIAMSETGIFHVTSTDQFTPYALGNYLLEKKRHVKNSIEEASLVDYIAKTGNENRYPQYGGLSVMQTEKELDMTFLTWQQTIDSLINDGLV